MPDPPAAFRHGADGDAVRVACRVIDPGRIVIAARGDQHTVLRCRVTHRICQYRARLRATQTQVDHLGSVIGRPPDPLGNVEIAPAAVGPPSPSPASPSPRARLPMPHAARLTPQPREAIIYRRLLVHQLSLLWRPAAEPLNDLFFPVGETTGAVGKRVRRADPVPRAVPSLGWAMCARRPRLPDGGRRRQVRLLLCPPGHRGWVDASALPHPAGAASTTRASDA